MSCLYRFDKTYIFLILGSLISTEPKEYFCIVSAICAFCSLHERSVAMLLMNSSNKGLEKSGKYYRVIISRDQMMKW